MKALFQAAVERPVEERDAFLAAATGDDEALRREVESLLTSDASDDSFLDQLPVVDEPVRRRSHCPARVDWTTRSLTPSSPPGLRVGPYEIVAPLGAGAMGEVYRARDTKLNRDVALKVLPERFALDPDRLARFTREAQLLATLNHPNIAAIYGLEESSGAQALVMELVEGPTLADRIARGPIPVDEALTIARQIAEALEAAHEKGIIHRDLKPANIKIARSGVVKVLDFGLAKVWDGAPQSDLSASPRLTATALGERAILGTPAYMSPEQARGAVAGPADGHLVVRLRAVRNAHGPRAVRRRHHLRHPRRDSRTRAGPDAAAGRHAIGNPAPAAAVFAEGSPPAAAGRGGCARSKSTTRVRNPRRHSKSSSRHLETVNDSCGSLRRWSCWRSR